MTLSDYTTVEGDRIELRCFASANPSPKITWSRNGIPISNETARMYVNDDILIIDNVENDDAGHYICKASNAAGDAEKAIRLTVISKYLRCENQFKQEFNNHRRMMEKFRML